MKSKKLISGLLTVAMTLSIAAPGGLLPRAAAARTNTLGDGLVLYSTFDDETAKDQSGNGHDGTVVGGIAFVAGKDGGKAIQITGQNAAGNDNTAGDRYVDYGKSADIIPGTGNFSISLWYQSTGGSSNATILSNKNFASGANQGFALGDFASSLRMNLTGASGGRKDINNGNNSTALGAAKTTKNVWNHLVVTVDRTGVMSYYVNGALADKGTADITGATGSIDAGLNLVLGAGGNYKNATDNCLLDDLLIYDRVITTTEISLLHNKTAPDLSPLGLEDGILLDVDFENNVNDKSGHNYNGTITGEGVTYVDSPFGSKAVKIVNKNAAAGAANDNATADSYVNFGDEISQSGLGGKNFTMSFWYKPDPEMNSWGAIISNKNYASGANKGFALGYYAGNDCKMNLVPANGTGNTQVAGINLHQDGGWHHFTATVVPGGTLTAYVDGQSVGSKAIPTGTIHAGFPLILGAGGNRKNPITNVIIDELRFYDRALDSSSVQALYALNADNARAANAPLILSSLKDSIEAVETGLLFPEADKTALLNAVQALADAISAGSLTSAQINERLSALEASYQSFLNGKTPLASFHLISDVHVENADQSNGNTVRYIAAMKDMKTLNTDTTIAFVNAGDNTQSAQSNQYEGFYTATQNHNPVTAAQTLILLGNHDVRGTNSGGNWNKDPNGNFPYWNTAKNLYITNNAPYMPESAKTTLYHAKTLGTVTDTEGYTFIMLNTEIGLKDSMYMSDEQVAWFEATMKEAYERNPNKPIFIVSHQALNDTHWRSNTLNGFDGVTTYNSDGTEKETHRSGNDAKVKAIMEQYPNGIFLSGHIHNGFGVASIIPREYGVNVDIPSFNESENGMKDQGIGYEVMIYDGYVAFRARNFATSTWLPQYDVIVPVGEQGYPQLIQKLESTMDDLNWYSEADEAKLTEAFGDFWSYAGLYYDQGTATLNGIAYNAKPPAELIYTPGQLAEMSAAAENAWANLGVLNEVTRLDAPRKDAYEQLQEKWRAYLLGGTGTDLDLDDPAVAAYVKGLNKEANGYWNTLITSDASRTSFIFPNLDMSKDGASNIATTFARLRTLAMAWATKGCDLYGSDLVLQEIINATDYVVDNYYYANGKYTTSNKAPGNWYHWDISAPTNLGNIAMILYDELGAARIENYGKAIQWYAPSCQIGGPHSGQSGGMTGGNLLLKANSTAQGGVLLKDASMLENVSLKVKETSGKYNDPDMLFSTGNPGDGFYADGSYIQHQALPYIAGYGADLYNNFAIFSVVLKDSAWEIAFGDDEDPVIYDFVFSGIEPFIYENRTMDMVTSRAITRKGYSDVGKTASIVSALLPMRGTFPTQEQNARFDSMMKYYLSLDPERYLSGNIYSLKIANELLHDDTIQPRSNYALTKTFAMDRTVHITKDFGMGIAMQSTRTFAHEIINEEGKRTWNIANGMVFLYNEDENQFNGGYWCTIDPTRLPGITTEHVVYANGRGSLNTNIYDWTGGSSIGGNGVAGMHMKALSRNDNPTAYKTGPRTGADMKKSYFMFGDHILMMGSGITSTTGDNVETTVENRKIHLDGSNVVTVDGAVADLSTDASAPSTLANPTWMHLEGNVEGADIGYYFPQDITLNAMKDTRTGNWADQGTTSGTATDTYATFYVDHGVKPTNAGYAYVLLPGKSAEETAAYAANADVEILRNDTAVHAARDNSQGILAANFWEADSVDVITVGQPASVIMERKGGTVTLGVSDPTQRDVTIEVSLAMTGDVLSKDGSITVLQTKPFIKLSIDTTEGLGGTNTISFALGEVEQVELLKAHSKFDTVMAQPGTSFYDLALPTSAIFTANDTKQYELELSWSRGDYDANGLGRYTLVGVPVLSEGIYNTIGTTVTVTVETIGYQNLAVGDTYVNDGDYADTNYGSSGALVIKNQTLAGYMRHALIQFDLTTLPKDCESIVFKATASIDDGLQGGAVYLVDNDWDAGTVTWNTMPEKLSEAAVATFTKNSPVDGILTLDVTGAVRAAIAKGETTISFMISATGASDGKNQMSLRSLESDAAQKPALVCSKSSLSSILDKENLKFLVNFAEEVDGSLFLNYNKQELDAAIANGKAVLDTTGATMSQVNDAEDALMRILLSLRLTPVI